MLYWYSGTGNSRYVASRIASLVGESDCRFIPHELGIGETRKFPQYDASRHDDKDSVGFCFPVYSWGVPPVVLEFVRKMPSENLRGRYLYAVLTCGDEAGLAAEMLRKRLKEKGVALDAVFSVIMPNDYVMLPGFDVDTPEVEAKKLSAAGERIAGIASVVNAREEADDVFRGPMAWLKTRLVFPLFRRWGVQTGRWKVDAEKCIGCGKCAATCPAANIKLTEGRPQWGKRCWSCTACFHTCPVRAIEYGSFTRGKGRYICPLGAEL